MRLDGWAGGPQDREPADVLPSLLQVLVGNSDAVEDDGLRNHRQDDETYVTRSWRSSNHGAESSKRDGYIAIVLLSRIW